MFFQFIGHCKGGKKKYIERECGEREVSFVLFFFFTKFPFINFKSIQIIWEILNRELFCLLLICFVNFSVNCSHLANHIPYKHSFHCITLFVFTLIVFADAIFIYVLWFECTGTAFFFFLLLLFLLFCCCSIFHKKIPGWFTTVVAAERHVFAIIASVSRTVRFYCSLSAQNATLCKIRRFVITNFSAAFPSFTSPTFSLRLFSPYVIHAVVLALFDFFFSFVYCYPKKRESSCSRRSILKLGVY